MMYVIYRNNKFVGYTEDKEIFKKFKEVRKDGKYTYRKIKKKNIPQEIYDIKSLENYSLDYYVGYRLYNELPLFLYEFEELDQDLPNDILLLSESLYAVIEKMKFLKMDNIDRRIIELSAKYLNELLESFVYTHEMVFDEIIDLVQYINKKDRNS